jgi:DNA-binding response OmpR family regulator
MHILLVEDDLKICSFTARGLREEGYSVDVAHDGNEGLTAALMGKHDLLLLDVRLPHRDGVEIVREVRSARMHIPIILVTAAVSISDRVRGLDAGANDYITKPFAFEELLARIRAVLRRLTDGSDAAVLSYGGIVVDLHTQSVVRDGRPIELTAREYALLLYFLRHPGRVLSRSVLLEHVWDQRFDPETNVIEALVYRLREKIDRGFGLPLLRTLRGRGYMLQEPQP